jgi:hypothetical protein
MVRYAIMPRNGAYTSRNRNTDGVIPMLGFTLDAGRSISGGGWFGDFNAFAFFLFISGDCFPSGGELALCHSFCHSCNGLAASSIRVRGMYSSCPVVTNSSSSIFCSASKCALRVPLAINCFCQQCSEVESRTLLATRYQTNKRN